MVLHSIPRHQIFFCFEKYFLLDVEEKNLAKNARRESLTFSYCIVANTVCHDCLHQAALMRRLRRCERMTGGTRRRLARELPGGWGDRTVWIRFGSWRSLSAQTLWRHQSADTHVRRWSWCTSANHTLTIKRLISSRFSELLSSTLPGW